MVLWCWKKRHTTPSSLCKKKDRNYLAPASNSQDISPDWNKQYSNEERANSKVKHLRKMAIRASSGFLHLKIVLSVLERALEIPPTWGIWSHSVDLWASFRVAARLKGSGMLSHPQSRPLAYCVFSFVFFYWFSAVIFVEFMEDEADEFPASAFTCPDLFSGPWWYGFVRISAYHCIDQLINAD